MNYVFGPHTDSLLGGETRVNNHSSKTLLVVVHQVLTHSKLQLPAQIFKNTKVWRLAKPLHHLNVLPIPLWTWWYVLGYCPAERAIHDPSSVCPVA